MALYFECRLKQKRTPLDCFFFGDFAHWVISIIYNSSVPGQALFHRITAQSFVSSYHGSSAGLVLEPVEPCDSKFDVINPLH